MTLNPVPANVREMLGLRRSRTAATLVLVFALAFGPAAPRAAAMDRDVRTVLVAGEYGLLGGTLLGLATVPFNQDSRAIFIGSSVGLYLGLAVGLYYVFQRESANALVRSGSSSGPASLLGAAPMGAHRAPGAAFPPPLLATQFTVLRF